MARLVEERRQTLQQYVLLVGIILHDQSHLAPSSPSFSTTIVEFSQGKCPYCGAGKVLIGEFGEAQQTRLSVPFDSTDTWDYLLDNLQRSVILVRKGDGTCKCLCRFPGYF